jgi:phosphoribosylformylglycinamidine cyclo-ligase
MRAAVRTAGGDLHAVAHVTGGGLPGAVPRIVPDGLAARMDPATWPMPSVMQLLGTLGGLGAAELRATFNGGLGMVVAMPAAAVDAALATAAAAGIGAHVAGEIVSAADLGGRRYVEVER